MSSMTFLDIKYNLSKQKFLRKPSRMFSRDRQNSGPVYQPSLEEMRQVFDKFDSNKDGKISQEEYRVVLRALGRGVPVILEVQKIFEVADLDGDGYIDFNEFLEVHRKGGGVKTMDLHGAFRVFDKDGDGKISVDEVYELLQRLGERCSLKDCRKMVKAVDVNGDNLIDLDEFMTMMNQAMKLY